MMGTGITLSVLACIKLGYNTSTVICNQLDATSFSAREQVRNALQFLRKNKWIVWQGRKWIER
jgi:hypothetical protein